MDLGCLSSLNLRMVGFLVNMGKGKWSSSGYKALWLLNLSPYEVILILCFLPVILVAWLLKVLLALFMHLSWTKAIFCSEFSCRKPGKENLFRCTYVLPDGISYTKGFVKNPDEAQRYLSLTDEASSPSPSFGVKKDVIELDVSEKPEDRKRIDLTKNVNSHFCEPISSFPFLLNSIFMPFAGIWLNKWTLPCSGNDIPSCRFGSVPFSYIFGLKYDREG